jgi:hypothetical protein
MLLIHTRTNTGCSSNVNDKPSHEVVLFSQFSIPLIKRTELTAFLWNVVSLYNGPTEILLLASFSIMEHTNFRQAFGVCKEFCRSLKHEALKLKLHLELYLLGYKVVV